MTFEQRALLRNMETKALLRAGLPPALEPGGGDGAPSPFAPGPEGMAALPEDLTFRGCCFS